MSTTYSQMIHCHHYGGGGRGGAKIVVNTQRDKVNVTKCLQLVKVDNRHTGHTNPATM